MKKLLVSLVILALILAPIQFATAEESRIIQINMFGIIDNDRATDGWSADDAIAKLDSATANDTVVIILHSPGGRVDSGIRIVEAMDRCKGKVVVFVPRFAASMAAHIATHANRILLTKQTIILFHAAYGYLPPFKLHQVARDFQVWQIEELKHLFSPIELWAMVFRQKEFVLGGEEYKTRMEQMDVAKIYHPGGIILLE